RENSLVIASKIEPNMSFHEVFNDKSKVSSSQITIEDVMGNVSKASLFRWSVNKNSDEIMQQTAQDSNLIMHLLKPHPSLYHSHENSKRVGYKNHTDISKSKKRKREVSSYNIKKNSRK
ncbi:12493_t:CDS:2, partial [Gigaspora margarita]